MNRKSILTLAGIALLASDATAGGWENYNPRSCTKDGGIVSPWIVDIGGVSIDFDWPDVGGTGGGGTGGGGTGGGGTGGGCVRTSNKMQCKGKISIGNVTKRGNLLEYGRIDIWAFYYTDSRKGEFQHHHSYQKNAIISASPTPYLSDPLDLRCVHIPWNAESSFSFNRSDLANQWECPLENDTWYYLKLELASPITFDSDYYLIATSQPQ